VLSKLVEFKDFTLFRGITTQDVKEHLLERRKIHMPPLHRAVGASMR